MTLIDILIYSIVGQCMVYKLGALFFSHLLLLLFLFIFIFFNLPPGYFDLDGMILFISARYMDPPFALLYYS